MEVFPRVLTIPRRLFFLVIWVLYSGAALAEPPAAEVPIGVNEQLGKVINLNYRFVDESGDTITLADLVDRPTLLSFVYYTCPGICSPLLSGLHHAVDKVQLEPGIDFQVITISINEDETATLAREKKQNYYKQFTRYFPENAWHWLTGDSANIRAMVHEVGYAFRRSGDDFAHPAVIMALSGDGKIARYLYGVSFNHFDVKMALLEASEGRVGPTIAKAIKFCFSYDPEGRTYVFNILKVTASLVLLFVTILFVTLTIRSKKTKPSER